MPFAILKSIYAVNSEDSSYPASSLLKNESGKKWKTSSSEKSAYVIIQLENELTITGIDIGNEHSAFVEVLVGKTKKSDEFKEILLTSSFMTPIESKNSSNTNRVRCFPKEQLIESIVKEKWDLVKFVCTQPFNKHCQYGLSFIKIHVTDESKDTINKSYVPEKFLRKNSIADDDEEKSSSNQLKNFLGKFKLREESPDSESENNTSSSSLFNRWKNQSKTTENIKKNISTAAAIREASTPNSLKRNAESLKPAKIIKKKIIESDDDDDDAFDKKTILDRNRNDLLYNENDDKPNDKYDKKISLDQERFAKDKDEQNEKKLKLKQNKEILNKKQTNDNDDTSSKFVKKNEKDFSFSSKFSNFFDDGNDDNERKIVTTPKAEKPLKTISNINNSTKKRLSSPIKNNTPNKKIRNEKELDYKPFNKLLEGVILTISGIQNPDRADIRSKCLAMGAKYKPDWDSNCTHLICAFRNTPKYLQVQQENGKIVTRKWIETCYKTKKRLPWRRYALDKNEIDKPESEEEILDIKMKPSPSPEPFPTTPKPSTSSSSKKDHLSPITKSLNIQRESHENTLARYDLGNDDDDFKDDNYHVLSSGSDTEEEIEKIRQKQKLNNAAEKPKTGIKHKNIEEKEIIDENEIINKLQDVYDVSTEEEEFTKNRRQQQESKYFFRNKKFYLTSKLNSVDKIKLKSIIEQYNGELIESLRQANFIISNESIEVSNIQGIVISPLWIYECNDMECLIPTTRYLI